MTDLPEQPDQRGIILPLTQAELALCKSDPESRGMLADSSVAVVELPLAEAPKPGSLLSSLASAGQLESGAPLVLDPHRGEIYYAVAEASTQIAASKHQLAIELVQVLGAKQVELHEVRRLTRNSRVTVAVSGSRTKLVSGSGKFETEEAERLVQKLTTRDEFAGGEARVGAAEAFLEQHGLGSDSGLRTLVALRANDANPVVQHQVRISTQNESRRTRNLLLKCKLPTVAAQADIATAVSEQVEYELTFTVSF